MAKKKATKKKTKSVYVETMEEFEKFTGLLSGEQILDKGLNVKLGLDSDEIDDDGGIDANHINLKLLAEFVDNNSEFHIISRTEGENNADCYSNEIRYVNRMKYYLGDGSKEEMEFVDPDSIRESCDTCDGVGQYTHFLSDELHDCDDCDGTGEKQE